MNSHQDQNEAPHVWLKILPFPYEELEGSRIELECRDGHKKSLIGVVFLHRNSNGDESVSTTVRVPFLRVIPVKEKEMTLFLNKGHMKNLTRHPVQLNSLRFHLYLNESEFGLYGPPTQLEFGDHNNNILRRVAKIKWIA